MSEWREEARGTEELNRRGVGEEGRKGEQTRNKRGGVRGRREKSQRRPMRKEEGRRRREPKLLILKRAQQSPWPWALVTLLPLFSWLGNGHISPSARTSEAGEGAEDRSTYWPFNTYYVTKLTGEVGGIRTPPHRRRHQDREVIRFPP